MLLLPNPPDDVNCSWTYDQKHVSVSNIIRYVLPCLPYHTF
jgi:hypothetical protein